MSVADSQPVSVGNLRAAVAAIIDRYDSIASTFATVEQYTLETAAGTGTYQFAFRTVSSSGLSVATQSVSGVPAVVTVAFTTPGVYRVATTTGFVAKVLSGAQTVMEIAGEREFNWDSASSGSLVLSASGYRTSQPRTSQLTVERVS